MALRPLALLALVVLLAVLAAAYVEAVSSRAVLALVVLAPALVAAVSPLAGVTLALAGAPLVDVVASALTARVAVPELVPIAWVEPFWLGIGAGLVLARLRRRSVTAVPAGFGLALWTLAGIAIVALGGLAVEWRAQLPALARVAWRSLPWFDGATADHVFRASLLLVSGPAWAWLVARSLRDGRDARWVWGAWLVTSTVTAAYGTWMWSSGAVRRLPRLGAPVPDDINSYASYLVLSVFIALALLAGAQRLCARALFASAGAIAAWMLLPTGSHTAVLAVLAGTCALAVWPTFAWRRLAAALAVVAVLGVGVGALALTERSRHVLGVASESVDPRFLLTYFRDGRQAIWAASSRAVLAHPVLGLGPGALYRRLGEFYREGDVGWRPAQENAHNYLLQLAAETGIPGLVAFLLATAAVVWAALLGRTSDPVRGRVLAVGVLAYLVTCVGGHSLLLARQMLLFWGLVGTVLALGLSPAVPSATRTPTTRTTRHGLAVVAALVVLAVLLRPAHRACPPMPGGPGPIRIDFGVGFDSPVTVPSGRWRWMEDGGQIRFCNGSPAPLAAEVVFTAVAFEAARRLDVHGLGPRPLRIHVPPHQAPLSLAVAVPPGSSSLILVPRPGAWRIGAVKHDGDPHVVSVLLSDPAITIR